jgi:PIN domain nuclease of toxin-antitoxin system
MHPTRRSLAGIAGRSPASQRRLPTGPVSAAAGWGRHWRHRAPIPAKNRLIPANLEAILDEKAFEALPITVAHALEVATLPLHHADPFDRILVAQARLEGLAIVTADARIAAYGVAVVEA